VLLDGAHLLEEALNSEVELEVVAFSEVAAVREDALLQRAMQRADRVITVPAAVLAAMSPVRQPSGIVALARVTTRNLDSIVRARPPQLILLLDGVQDPGNVGASVIATEALGGTAVIAGSANPFSWKALRGSMGSALRLPVAIATDQQDIVRAVRDTGLRIFATVPSGGTPLHRAALDQPAVIFLGGEGGGLSEQLKAAADEQLTIAMRSPVESLTVSIAAALVLYEASRQRANVAVR
jgi:TrmH family RNA methyltransferase